MTGSLIVQKNGFDKESKIPGTTESLTPMERKVQGALLTAEIEKGNLETRRCYIPECT